MDYTSGLTDKTSGATNTITNGSTWLFSIVGDVTNWFANLSGFEKFLFFAIILGIIVTAKLLLASDDGQKNRPRYKRR